ncbi:MAG TPA: hypothetical protein VM925_05360, partial [Labilithrix sp.]|nr:hypothetical protein [Labilithrix sp.]
GERAPDLVFVLQPLAIFGATELWIEDLEQDRSLITAAYGVEDLGPSPIVGPLAEVKAAAERVASSVVSIGVSLSSVSIPGQPFSQGRPRGNLDPTMALPGYAPSQGRPRSVAGGLSEQEIVAISRDEGLGPRK